MWYPPARGAPCVFSSTKRLVLSAASGCYCDSLVNYSDSLALQTSSHGGAEHAEALIGWYRGYIYCTPKTWHSPLKIYHPKRKLVFQTIHFQIWEAPIASMGLAYWASFMLISMVNYEVNIPYMEHMAYITRPPQTLHYYKDNPSRLPYI